MKRRAFLSYLSLLPSVKLLNLSPKAITTDRNLILVNLSGGLDSLYAFPYFGGDLSSTIGALRPTLRVTESDILPLGFNQGFSDPIGFHASLTKLHQSSAGQVAMVEGYGILNNESRSHELCQNLMSLGQTSMGTSDMHGYMARIYDTYQLSSSQFFSFWIENRINYNVTSSNPPTVVESIDKLNYSRLGFETDTDAELAHAVSSNLIAQQVPTDALHDKYNSGILRGDALINQVKLLGEITVGNNQFGNYDYSQFGQSMQATAKLIKSKTAADPFALSGKPMIILAGMNGFDTHSNQLNPYEFTGNLPNKLKSLGDNLAVLIEDLKATNQYDKTLIILYSEFGRTTYENGSPGSLSVGSDHGHGSSTILLGGNINPGRYGFAPTSSELTSSYNAIIPRVDYRDVLSEGLHFLGVDPALIFTEAGYLNQRLGIV